MATELATGNDSAIDALGIDISRQKVVPDDWEHARMRTGHYTRLKGRVTYFRRKIPEFLQERLASTEICCRLGVISSGLAERLGRRLAVEVDEFFERAKTDTMLTSTDLTKIVQTALVVWRQDDDANTASDIARRGRVLLEPRAEATARGELGLGIIRQVGNGARIYDAPFVSGIMNKAGLPDTSDEAALITSGRALGLGLAAHYLQQAISTAKLHGLDTGMDALPVAEWAARLAAIGSHLGLDEPQPDLPSKGSYPSERGIDTRPTPVPDIAEEAQGSAAYVSDEILFSEFVETCVTARISAGEVKSDIRHEISSSVRIWIEAVGDRPITTYKRSDFREFLSILQQVPQMYWRSDASRKMTIQQVIANARSHALASWKKTASAQKTDDPAYAERAAGDYKKLSNVTINRHLSSISPIFNWAYKNQELPDDTRIFWTDMHVPTGAKFSGLKANQQRPAFSQDQIRKIAEHPVWTGRKSNFFYNSPGKIIIRDSLYWGFPIALLQGLRREEFSQLGVRHVRKVDGVWVFDLYAKDLVLKNLPSKRFSPLHSRLLDLGFLEAMVHGRAPSEALFVELEPAREYAKFGDAVGKRFSRVLDNAGIEVIRIDGTESDGVFHPLRHRFVTDLLSAGVREGVVDALSGHGSEARKTAARGRDGERHRYDEDPPVAQLKAAIEQLPEIVDFELWKTAWARLGRRR